MDVNKIKLIKEYYDQIIKFRKLDKFKNMNTDSFSQEMTKIFPKFCESDKIIFDAIISGKDLQFFDLMFNKLKLIDDEYNKRKNEIEKIKNQIESLRSFIKLNDDMDKKMLIEFIKKNYKLFIEKYPIIYNRLMDKETQDLTIEQLFLDEVKHKYEIQIGEILAQQYIYPKVN